MGADTLMSSAARQVKAAAKPHATDMTKHAAALAVKKAQKALAEATLAAETLKTRKVAGALKINKAAAAMKVTLHRAVHEALKAAVRKTDKKTALSAALKAATAKLK